MTANRIHNSGRGRLVSRDAKGGRELAYHGVSLIVATAPFTFPVPMPDDAAAASKSCEAQSGTSAGFWRAIAAGDSFAEPDKVTSHRPTNRGKKPDATLCARKGKGTATQMHDRITARFVGMFICLVCAACYADPTPAFYRALHQVETGGRVGPIKGDGGKALGPYQIHRAYWIDSRVPGSYEQCASEPYARRVVQAYLKRYAPQAFKAGDSQTLARTHNGGPSGHKKQATISYWRKVKSHL